MNVRRLAYWVSMTDPKYLPMMGLPMLVPYLSGPVPQLWILIAGCAAVVILNGTAVLVNMYADRQLDAVNFPAGFRAITTYIGYDRLRIWIVVGVTLLIGATSTMWIMVSHVVAIVYLIGWLIAITYSVGPRLKRSLLLSRLAMACGPTLAFVGGWSLRGQLRDLPPAVALLFVGQGVHLLLKDVPDAEGDRRAGVRTLFTGLERRQLRWILPLLWCTPYLVASIGVGAGWWPSIYLALWFLYPFGLIVIGSALRAAISTDRELVRELAQVYATIYVLAVLNLIEPTGATVVLSTMALVYYFGVLALGVDRRGQGHGLRALARFAAMMTRDVVPAYRRAAQAHNGL